MGRLGLTLESGPYVVGRMGSGIQVSASVQIIPRPVDRLGLGLEPHVVAQLGSGPRVGAVGVISEGIFGRGIVSGGSCLQGIIFLNQGGR